MTYTNRLRTVCEVIRELNDVINTEKIDNKTKNRLTEKTQEIYGMVKRMNKKLVEYKEGYDKGWYKVNENYENSLKKRGTK